ncbi:hypothetical protein K9L16_00440 [Candidatus Pacearchaeota archaeon]|nr:hypothetical protein [Candidatus Pacearchaeota archaeon]
MKLKKILSESVESSKYFYRLYFPKIPPCSMMDDSFYRVVFTNQDWARQKERVASYDFSLN